MKLVYASSPSHDILRDIIFLGTLKDKWEPLEIRYEGDHNGDYRSAEWQEIILDRAKKRLEITKSNVGEVLIFADVDIQWFKPCSDILIRHLDGNDIVFQQEWVNRPLINGGFMACRANAPTIELFTRVVEALEINQKTHMVISDQKAFNKLILSNKMPCSYCRLPVTFLNDNVPDTLVPKPQDIIMYHSIRTIAKSKTSVQMKLEQHLRARQYVLGTTSIFRD